MKIGIPKILLAACLVATASGGAAPPGSEAQQSRYSTTVEKERPELNDETRRLIATYRRDPSEANLAALRQQVASNYDQVLERKRKKLEELERTAKHASKVEEMQGIVDEMVRNRTNRIDQSMRRFTDPRLAPGARSAGDGFVPVLGAAQNVDIACVPVTNEGYSRFIEAAGRKAPDDWKNGDIPANRRRHPVVDVSYEDAAAYCKWLSERDGNAVYRLPTETEWELAAGHMPKDADFNCGVNDGTTPVDAYANTLAACGAIDMWGNCWEWTSTKSADSRMGRAGTLMVVKGGSWSSPRMSCRTEHKGEARQSSAGFRDVGFRVIREK